MGIGKVVHLMDVQAVQGFWRDYACRATQVGESRKRFLENYDILLTEYDCSGCDPRQAPRRGGLGPT
jgi:hypothetical protein